MMKEVDRMADIEYRRKIKDAILARMRYKRSTSITMKDTGDELIISRDGNEFTLYNNCELVIGDVSIDFIAELIATNNVKPY